MTNSDPPVQSVQKKAASEGTVFITAGVIALGLFMAVGVWAVTPDLIAHEGGTEASRVAFLLSLWPSVFMIAAAILAAVAVIKEFIAGEKKQFVNLVILVTLCVLFIGWVGLAWIAARSAGPDTLEPPTPVQLENSTAATDNDASSPNHP